MSSPGRIAYQFSFDVCPIILNNGVASAMPGGMLPIIAITEALNFVQGLLSGAETLNLDNFFAHYIPIGARLISQRFGKYPFANQSVASNSVIKNALSISLLMIATARGPGGFATKLATMTALKATFEQHNASGGTYIIATPSFFYPDCLFADMRDVTPPSSTSQPQAIWQLDFEQPLITLNQAQQAQNALMSQITGGTQIVGQPTWSGINTTVGQQPTLAGAALLPSSTTAGAANVTGGFGSGAAAP